MAATAFPSEEFFRTLQQLMVEQRARFRSLGFNYVTIDLAGFRSGSLNAVLAHADRTAERVDRHPV